MVHVIEDSLIDIQQNQTLATGNWVLAEMEIANMSDKNRMTVIFVLATFISFT